MLDHILVPWHQAPGEAEAECALLQQKGLVDAIWSEDGDPFMFGCTLLIKDLRNAKNHKLKEEARSFDMRDIRKTGLFNKKSITLFGMLTECDYAPAGLKGCGESIARQLTKNGGLVEGFWRIQTEADAARWRTRLEEAIDRITSSSSLNFNKERSNIGNFPSLQALRNCRNPTVSDAATLNSLPFLQGEWYRTHTTESMRTTIPWMQARFFSRMATIWWVEQFIPVTMNQRFLKNNTEARNLVAKVVQKRKDGPTTSVEFDPCQVFFGIEKAVLISEGNHLLNRWGELDRRREGQPIMNAKVDMLDAILSQGLSDAEFQRWRKEPKTPPPNKIHPVHPPQDSKVQQTPLGSDLSFVESLFPAGTGSFTTPLLSFSAAPGGDIGVPQDLLNQQQQILDDTQSSKKQTPIKDTRSNRDHIQVTTPIHGRRRPGTEHRVDGQSSGTGHSSASDTTTVRTPISPDTFRRKRLAKLDAGRGGGSTTVDARLGNFSSTLDKIWSLDEEDDEAGDIRGGDSKKRKLESSLAEYARHAVPGARGRQMLLEMELDSSQDSMRSVPVRTKGSVRNNPSAKDAQPGAAKPLASGCGKGTADDPLEIL
ncbi:flap endonuclease GEN 1 [Colletotrichum spaethianum]|uniref:Flap endonuclease GEN 1 n=1 Tax=Colletotrichum spaethianum TaxID=700344 RepID=A0AA37LCW0_9PEZI|nr:flap endonuclease GEN 1 [Colletotrichum spaethianum]GKT44043.1 flap endonuclease GEN 1 [Colletotrichum spaethianum]